MHTNVEHLLPSFADTPWQDWNLSSGNPRTDGIRHSLGHVSRRRPHHLVFLPALPSFLAGEPKSWQNVSGYQFAGICVDGLGPQYHH